MCGAPAQDAPTPDRVRPWGGTVIEGTVLRAGEPVPGAYATLLDAGGEFVAEVVTGARGGFRFYAAPGSWTVRALAGPDRGQTGVEAGDTCPPVTVELAPTA